MFTKSFCVLDVKIIFHPESHLGIAKCTVGPNSQGKGLCQWKKVTLNTSFTVCTLMSGKQNCPSEPVII